MSRRILLIDADTQFRTTLTQHLGRYRVAVTTETDPDRALASAASNGPDLLVIAVEEPDKAGFKTFQRARKALPAKLPIVLVTKSMSADSFAKHRSLKVHADEYIDKRGLSKEELIGKLDNLIGLGDLQEDDVSIPVEDEIPMEIADGDVVLDDHLDDDPAAEFQNPHEMATVGGNNTKMVDQMVSKELDGAFDSLLADDAPAPGMMAIPDPVERVNAKAMELPTEAMVEPVSGVADKLGDNSGIPEPVPHVIPEPEEEPVAQKTDWDADSIPAPIMDGGRPTGGFDAVGGAEPNVDDLPEAPRPSGSASEREEVVASDAVVSEEPAPLDDEEGRHEQSLSSIPMVDDDLVSLDDDAIEEVEEPPAAKAAEPTPVPAPEAVPEAVPAAPILPPGDGSAVGRMPERAKRVTGSQASIDLGLDKLAQDAESEQSGVYDRKSLRKIGELERQIAQLKNELERARTDAEKAAKGGGRETQFLSLRESNLAKEKELKQVKTAHEHLSKEHAEATEKLRQTQQAKQALEAKHAETEQELDQTAAKAKELAASLRDATAQAAQLEQELAAESKAATTAQTKVAQLEKDLANERATGAASASEAERRLRTERDQMLIRHKGELAATRAEVEAHNELAMGRMREELDAERQLAVEEAIEATRKANAAEHAKVVEQLEGKHNAELISIKSEHAGELSRVTNELGGEIERVKGELAEAHAQRVAAIATAHDEKEAGIAAAHQDRDAAIAAIEKQRDAAVAEVHAQRKAELAAAEQQRVHDLEQLKVQHAADVEAREEEHQEALERDAQSHGQALSQMKQELDRTVTSFETKLAAARNDNDVLVARHGQAMQEFQQLHEQTMAKLKAEQDEELELMADGARRSTEKHRQEIADQQAKYEARITELQTNAEREIGELQSQVHTAKRAADETAARHAAEQQETARIHAERIDEIEANHERALETANNEHAQVVAQLKAEADRMVQQLEERAKAIADLEAEREELRRGLSGTRDSLKQSQGELSSAIQTIADRNADLRAHAQAIAERDQRIADLRKELEQLEQENANYQEQVLRAYQKIKTDEAMVARARKAMAIALTVLDDDGNPKSSSS